MFFTDKKRKKNLIFSLLALTFFCGVVFLAQIDGVYAASKTAVGAAFSGLGFLGGTAINVLLYPLFVVLGWVASLAISIFEWVIRPEDVALLLNSPGVYESWKFVRDFFNLFFILVLLYIAFTVVFQINKDFKKAILSLVLAALFINFSFPVSRALIDATNVPMYFFANQMMGRNASQGTGIFGGVMTATNLERILLPGSNNGSFTGALEASYKNSVPRMIMAIVFMFLFSITLLVLAVMFVTRLTGLVVLVIFSSVGFAASIIPGLGQYSKMWWDNFWKYAIFGPAAMLMLLIATRFFAEIGGENGSLMKSMKIVTSGTVVASDQTFFASMALFTIPIIMLWMAMGLAQKMSIAGADTIVGLGQKFTKWVGKTGSAWVYRKVENRLPPLLRPRAIYRGVKQFFEHQAHEDELPLDQAKAKVHNMLNKTVGKLPWMHDDATDYEFVENMKQAAPYMKEIIDRCGGTLNENGARQYLAEAEKEHNTQKILAAQYSLARTNGIDMIVDDHGAKYGATAAALPSGRTGIEIQANWTTVVRNMLQKGGVPDEEISRHIHNIGETGKTAGDFSIAEHTKVNITNGKWAPNPNQPADLSGQFIKTKSQTRQDIAHPRAYFKQYIDPATRRRFWGDVEPLVDALNNDDVKQGSRKRADTTEAMVDIWEEISVNGHRADYPNFVNKYNTDKVFHQFVEDSVNPNVPAGRAQMPAWGTPIP